MSRFKDKFASGAGSVLEWCDFALYGFFAPIIAQLYFPGATPGISLLKTFSVFATGFIARPIGALIFGAISDRYGRAVSLKITPVLISIPAFLFSILPTYENIGLLAPALLVILRVWQGVCIGGEYANNIVYLCETTQPARLFFAGSIGSCTGSFGIFLASCMAAISYKIFSSEDLLTWGWRLAFALTSILGVAAWLLRRNLQETPVFKALSHRNSAAMNPVLQSFKTHRKDYFIAIGTMFLPVTAFYYVFMFLPNFLDSILHMNIGSVLANNSLSLFSRLLIIPLLGLVADAIGGLRIARLSCILFLCTSYPLFSGIIHSVTKIGLLFFAFSTLTTLNAATTPGLLMNFFKPETRCTMLSFTFNLCFGVFGGVVPVIGFFLITIFENQTAPVYYLMFSALITLIATFFCEEKSTHVCH